jgi:ElaB/YqjD/DUF883 family membrane-anchored ribosome-binding protein
MWPYQRLFDNRLVSPQRLFIGHLYSGSQPIWSGGFFCGERQALTATAVRALAKDASRTMQPARAFSNRRNIFMVTAPEKDFQDDLKALRADIAALTATVGDLASQASRAEADVTKRVKKAAKGAIGAGEEMLDEGLELGHDAARAATSGARAGVASLEHQIEKNPMNAVLIALGIGFVVGLVGRK